METVSPFKRRKANRKPSTASCIVRVQMKDGMGHARWITADLLDRSAGGVGISLVRPLPVGLKLLIRGKIHEDQPDSETHVEVKWCVDRNDGTFRAGLDFLEEAKEHTENTENTEYSRPPQPQQPEELDCYETMQLSPNADVDTITRVYRILAQRFHPDNVQTGSSEMFVRLTEAYRILSDPEQRASYDVRHREVKQLHWDIFEKARAATGPEAEKQKRLGILNLLYAKTTHDPENASMTVFEFEQLLGCPREHLQAALWFLKGKRYVLRSDNGRFSLTVLGFEEAENASLQPLSHDLKLLNEHVRRP